MIPSTTDNQWIAALSLGALLKKKIIDGKLPNDLEKYEEGLLNNKNPIISSKSECPAYVASLRNSLWQLYEGIQSPDEKENKDEKIQSPDEKENKDKKIQSPDEIKDILEKIKKGLNSTVRPMQFEKPKDKDKVFDYLPEKIRDGILDWSVGRHHEMEYCHTILFAIYTSTLIFKGKADTDHLKLIDGLWEKIIKESKLFEDYLKEWRSGNKTYLTPTWLMTWFGIRLLKSEAFKAYKATEPREFSPEEALMFHRNLATLFLYVLFWMSNFGNVKLSPFSDVKKGYEAFLDSLIYLLCEYAHIDGEVTREAELYETMCSLWSHQSALYALAETYRDHLHHVLEVCLMGLYFMDSKDFGFSKLFYRKIERKKLLRNWIVTALFHDVGYAIKLLNMSLDQLTTFREETVTTLRKEMVDRYKRLEKKLGNRIWENLKEMVPCLQLPKTRDEFDHGVVSALQIIHLVAVPDDEWKQDMGLAVEAAAMHNHLDIDIDPNKKPLAFLLFFCDNLQEWDRPFIKGEQIRYSLLVNIVRTNSDDLHRKRSFLNYLILEREQFGNWNFILDFASAREMEYYPPLTWVGHGLALQRVINCSLPLSITLRHPVENGEYEMDLLQNFLREPSSRRRKLGKNEAGSTVLREWVKNARAEKMWYKYLRESEKSESIKYNLFKNTDGKKHISGRPKYFIADYIEWVQRKRGER